FDGDGEFFDLHHSPFGGGPFAPRAPKNCTFSATSGRVTCPSSTFAGLTIDRSFAYTDLSGKAQSAPDSNTNTVNTRSSVVGTIVTRDKKDTTTVNHASDR